jgi:antitoxin component of MazEF toxin-antitoxin module
VNIENTVFLCFGVLQVITADAIKSEHLKESWLQGFQISEIPEYLNNCLTLKEPHEKFKESIRSLACFKQESFAVVIENVRAASQSLIDLFELHSQISTQMSQLLNFLNYSTKSLNLDPQTDIPLPSEQVSKSHNFNVRLAGLYLEGFFESLIEYNLFLVDCINLYWDYFPQVIQEFITTRVSFEIKFKDSILTCNDLPKLIEFTYGESVLSLKNSLNLALEGNDSKPKINVDLSLEKKSKSSNELHVKSSSNINKDYTLEKMLDGVTPENQHETIEWGKPVGAEVW